MPEVIRLIEEDGWYLVAVRGNCCQYKDHAKRGWVTIAGHPNDDLAPGPLNSILKQGRLKGCRCMRYLVVIEKANGNYSAFSRDISECGATGRAREEVRRNMSEAIGMHLRGLAEDGLPVPEPVAEAEYVVPEPA